MKLKKVHCALQFEQSGWMKPYIELNTNLRKKVKSDFEKNFFKLMNNSVLGKTMENLRKQINVRLVRLQKEKKIRNLITNLLYARFVQFTNNLVGIQVHKEKIKLVKPVYTGMCILNLNKTLMYDFYYNHLKLRYGHRCELLYTDMDSLLLEIKTEEVYRVMQKDQGLHDTSAYLKDHFLHSQENKKVVGKMKDECSGVPIKEFVCLRSKKYSVKSVVDKIRKAKGMTKLVTKKNYATRTIWKRCSSRKPSGTAWTCCAARTTR